MPVAIAEVGLPGVSPGAVPATLPDGVSHRPARGRRASGRRRSRRGSTADAAAGRPVDLQLLPDASRPGRPHPRPRRPRRAVDARAPRPASTSTGWCSAPSAAGAAMALGPRGELPADRHPGCRPARRDARRWRSRARAAPRSSCRSPAPAGHAVLVGAGREQQRRLGGDRRRQEHRGLHPGRRLRQRLAGAAAVGLVLGDVAAGRRSRRCGSRSAMSVVALAAVPVCSRCAAGAPRMTRAGDEPDDARRHWPTRSCATGERPRALVDRGRCRSGSASIGAWCSRLVGRAGRRRAGGSRGVRARGCGSSSPLGAPLALGCRGAVRGGAAAPPRLRRRPRLARPVHEDQQPGVAGGGAAPGRRRRRSAATACRAYATTGAVNPSAVDRALRYVGAARRPGAATSPAAGDGTRGGSPHAAIRCVALDRDLSGVADLRDDPNVELVECDLEIGAPMPVSRGIVRRRWS